MGVNLSPHVIGSLKEESAEMAQTDDSLGKAAEMEDTAYCMATHSGIQTRNLEEETKILPVSEGAQPCQYLDLRYDMPSPELSVQGLS